MTKKLSRFNVLTVCGDCCLLYNTFSGALLELPLHWVVEGHLQIKKLTLDWQEHLERMGFLVPADFDELAMVDFYYQKQRFNPDSCILSIFPLEFDDNKICGVMSETVQKSILRLVSDRLRKTHNLIIFWISPVLNEAFLSVVCQLGAKVSNYCLEHRRGYKSIIWLNNIELSCEFAEEIKDNHVKSISFSLDWEWVAKNLKLFHECLGIFERSDISVDLRIFGSSKTAERDMLVKSKEYRSVSIIYVDTAPADGMDMCVPLTVSYKDLARDILGKRHRCVSCQTATIPVNVVIGSKGEMHKCLATVADGNQKIGHVAKFNSDMGQYRHELRWSSYSPLKYEECQACEILPLCMSHCPAVDLGVIEGPRCPEWKSKLPDMVRYFHKIRKG